MSISKIVATALLTVAATSAFAGPTLNFDRSHEGALIENFYNGGTDSFGNRGGDYGVTFVGGVVHYKNGLSYLTGVTRVVIAGGVELGVSLNFSTLQAPYTAGGSPINPGQNDFYVYVADETGKSIDSFFFPDTTSPFCTAYTGQYCFFDSAVLGVDDSQRLGSFSFDPRAALDTITLGIRIRPPSEFANVPEPTTISVLALGLLGLAGLRRKSST
jgi:hypothetical protein